MSDADHRAEARALRRSIARLGRSFRRTQDPQSPTLAQLSALGTLHRNGPMATGELAGFERLKPQSVTRLVAALADRGLIKRIVDEADRRRFMVAITAEGRRRLAREMQRRDMRLSHQLALLTATDREVLQAARVLLDRIADADDIDNPEPGFPASPLSEVLMMPDESAPLDIANARLRNSRFHDVDLYATGFRDVNLAEAMFSDINLSNAAFDDVRLQMARFTEVDFSGASIDKSNLTGMRIDGVLVSDLFETYRSVRE